MNPSTSKTTPMPVRRCDLNLSDEDDEEDESDDAINLKTKVVEVPSKTAQKFNFNSTKIFTPKICTPQMKEKAYDKSVTKESINIISDFCRTPYFKNNQISSQKLCVNKENEFFNTPYNNKEKIFETKKDPKKLLFSPAQVVYSSKKVIPQHAKHLGDIKEDNFLQSDLLNDSSFSKSYTNGLTGICVLNNDEKRDKLLLKDNDFRNELVSKDKIKQDKLLQKEEDTLGKLTLKNCIIENKLNVINDDTRSKLTIKGNEIETTELSENCNQKHLDLAKEACFKVPEILSKNTDSYGNTSCHVENENGELSRISFGEITYDVSKKLGSGGSSVVHLATQANNSNKFAIKAVKLNGDNMLIQGYLNEVKLLAKLQNSDVVIKMFNYAHLEKDNMLYVVMECGEKDFSSIIKSYNSSNKYPIFPIVILTKYWLQMLEAVNYIHKNGIVHSDIKPANFLKVGNRLKLIDFGIASNVGTDCTSIIKHVQTGTFNYMSPETLQDSSMGLIDSNKQPNFKISYKADVWSLGCILYLLLYGKTPFGHITRPLLKMAAITDPNFTIDYKDIDLYPAIFVKTAKRCLAYNPYDRPTVAELLELPREPFEYMEKI